MIRFRTSPLSPRLLGRKPVHIRDLLLPLFLALFALLLGVQVVRGERGLISLSALYQTKQASEARLLAIEAENEALRQNIRLLSEPAPDVDFLEERVRAVLGFVRPDEQVILLRPKIP